MGDVRWMAPFIVAERVKRKKDCMDDVRWKSELSQLPNKPLTVSLLIRRKMHPLPHHLETLFTSLGKGNYCAKMYPATQRQKH